MKDYVLVLNKLIDKYNEAVENKDINKMKAYEREIKKLNLLQAVSNYIEVNINDNDSLKNSM